MNLPPEIESVIGPDARWSNDHDGLSGQLWKTTSSVAGTYYVRRGAEAALEHDRLRWVTGRAPVPRIAAFTATASETFLVLADVQAPPISGPPALSATIAAQHLGTVLRELHLLPIDDCPFDSRSAALIDEARQRLVMGEVDVAAFGVDHVGVAPEALFDRLVARRPAAEDLVVTHGDFTPSNVLLRPDGAPVLIDIARLGVADRYRDLALVLRDLTESYGSRVVESFLDSYGLVDALDQEALYWYRLLDEFF